MNMFILLAGISLIFLICETSTIECCSPEENDTNDYLNTLQIIRKYGYPAESHIVETPDGYLLEIHRIPHGRHSNHDSTTGKKPPVFIQHGLLGSSADYFLIGSENALPFLLSDLGYDIWLGNVRGNVYSRAHVTLFPDESKFWNFSWHESAIYDVPAQIDFICNHTKHEKIIYIGFSMGTTIFFAMTSTRPEYNNKIELSLLMAAVGYVKNIKSPLLRFLAPFSEQIKVIADLIAKGEFLPDSKLLKIFGKIFCERNVVEKRLCLNAIFLIVGSDPNQFNKRAGGEFGNLSADMISFQTLLPVLINHFPEGYSAKGVNHYSQLVKSGKFRQYDYGEKGNELQYGALTPPDYNLSVITTSMYFYEGKNDYLSNLEDVQRLAKQLPTLRRLRVVEYPKFSHLDFLVSFDVKKLVYDVLIEDLTSYLNEDNKIDIQN